MVEEEVAALTVAGEMRGKAPKERGKAESEDRAGTSGGESLEDGTGRLRAREPLEGTLRDSVEVRILSLDVPDDSVDEEDEEEDEEDVGLPLVLGAGVLP